MGCRKTYGLGVCRTARASGRTGDFPILAFAVPETVLLDLAFLVPCLYRRGIRSQARPTLTLEVIMTGGSAERVRWDDWGQAVIRAFRYTHLRTGADSRSGRPCGSVAISPSTCGCARAWRWSAGACCRAERCGTRYCQASAPLVEVG
jgi:hypothetical protein